MKFFITWGPDPLGFTLELLCLLCLLCDYQFSYYNLPPFVVQRRMGETILAGPDLRFHLIY